MYEREAAATAAADARQGQEQGSESERGAFFLCLHVRDSGRSDRREGTLRCAMRLLECLGVPFFGGAFSEGACHGGLELLLLLLLLLAVVA